MIIQLTKKEFTELRAIVVSLNNPTATEKFNEIFSVDNISDRQVAGFVNPINKDIIIHINEKSGCKVLSGINLHAKELGRLIKNGVSISSAPKWISTLKGILNTITNSLK